MPAGGPEHRRDEEQKGVNLTPEQKKEVGRFCKFLDFAAQHGEQEITMMIKRLAGDRIPILIEGREMTGFLGRGGMGITFLVENKKLQRKEAMKCVLPSLQQGEEASVSRKKFTEEAVNSAKIEHPNVVGIFDIIRIVRPTNKGESKKEFDVIFSTYIEGRDAARSIFPEDGRVLGFPLLDEQGKETTLSNKTVLLLMKEIAKGLVAIHEKGLVDGDLKFENVLLQIDKKMEIDLHGTAQDNASPPRVRPHLKPRDIEKIFLEAVKKGSGFAKVADLGLSEPAGKEIPLQGTARYIAPEMYRASGEGEAIAANPAMDSYAFGLLLYEAFTGRPAAGAIDRTLHEQLLSEQEQLQKKQSRTKNEKEQLKELKHIIDHGEKNPLKKDSNQFSFGRVMVAIQRGSTISPDEKRLKGAPRAIKTLILDCTDIDPSKRPTMKQIEERLDRELKRLERGYRVPIAVISGVSALIVTAVLGILTGKSSARPESHISHDLKRATVQKTAESALLTTEKAKELQALLEALAAVQKVEQEKPEGYKPDTKGPPNDLEKTTAKLKAKKIYLEGIADYHRGETDKALEEFRKLEGGSFELLDAADQTSLKKTLKKCKTWKEMKKGIQEQAGSILKTIEPEDIDELISKANRNDADSISCLLHIKFNLLQLAGVNPENSIESEREALRKRNSKKFVTLFEKLTMEIPSISCLADPKIVLNPGDSEALQLSFVEKAEWLKTRIASAVKSKKSTTPFIKDFIRCLVKFEQFYNRFGQIGPISEDDKRSIPDWMKWIIGVTLDEAVKTFKNAEWRTLLGETTPIVTEGLASLIK